ncbi:Beta-galactosidase, partial [Operophtera brumata]
SRNASHHISIEGDNFMLDGQRLHIVSGSLHYFRVPAAYWRDRLHKLKAAGLNSVATYIEWSHHEPEERQYRFEGDHDIAAFVRIAAEEGLHGGFPYWLLSKYPNIKLRTTNQDFAKESEIWINKLFEQLEPLYGSDMPYKVQQKNMISKHVGTNAILYTTDGASLSYFTKGAIPGTLTTIDFGSSNSQYYPGWLTHWGENMARIPTEAVVKTFEDMLKNNINVNFYVFFGGTNFDFTAGANYDGTYQPDITSYDYDAPLTEAGDPTPKYYAIRNILLKYNFGDPNTDPPQPSPKGNYGTVTVSPELSLLSDEGRATLGKKYEDVHVSNLPTFEALKQRSGFVLYETTLTQTDGLLSIKQPRDLVFVFVDGILKGKISRMHKIYSLPLTSKKGSVLSLLVENQGRINYGPHIHDFKGILETVKYDNETLNGKWTITGYPLENIYEKGSLPTEEGEVHVPALYEGQFTLPEGTPLDTFLDTTGWDKGYIWINGHNLGRYWPTVGPQVTLYVPGVWLKPAPETNLIQILELNKSSKELAVKFIDHPILDRQGVGHAWIE